MVSERVMDAEKRWRDLVQQLMDICNLKVVNGDPIARERELFAELETMRLRHGEEFMDKMWKRYL